MRQFLVTGHDAPTTPEFSLAALPGAGRLDLLARCLTAALLHSHDLREDVRVHLVLADTFTVTVDGASVQGLHPDERSTAARIRSALERREEAVGRVSVDVSPGVSIARRGFERTLERLAGAGTVVHLAEDGDPAPEVDPPADPVFVLSDHGDFTDSEGERLAAVAEARVSLGPLALHADQAIVVAHNYLDTGGFRRYS